MGVIGRFVKKYGAVIFFPTVAFGSIYADWSHTRAWKESLREKAKNTELLSQ